MRRLFHTLCQIKATGLFRIVVVTTIRVKVLVSEVLLVACMLRPLDEFLLIKTSTLGRSLDCLHVTVDVIRSRNIHGSYTDADLIDSYVDWRYRFQ